MHSHSVVSWQGFSFELLCMLHLPQIKQSLSIGGIATATSSWRSNNAEHHYQIDMVIDRADRIINLCEMKYSETDYIVSAAFIKDQKRKIHDFRQITGTKYAIHSTLITTYAVENNAYAGELQAVITAEDLFR